MKQKKKKITIILISLLVLIIGAISTVFILNYKDNNALTLEESKWLDSNKYNVVDIALLNDIPVLSYEGNGLVYDYLDYVTEKYSVKFNVVPYKLDGTIDYKYKMDIVTKPKKNDIVLLQDNMVLITNRNTNYNSVDNINNLKIGILSSDKEIISSYFKNKNISLVEYNNYKELKNSIIESKSSADANMSPQIDGIIILKTVFTKEMIENNFNISFQFNDLNKYFVLSNNGNKELNSILYKSYNKWENKFYIDDYYKTLYSTYINFKNVSDIEQKKLNSKSYVYGFINYGIYNRLRNNKLDGLNSIILKDFNKFSKLSITYTKYNGLNKLLKDFNSNKIDFMLNIADTSKYKVSTYNTVGFLNKNLAIVSDVNNMNAVDGIYSLKNKEVLVIKDSYLEKYLIDNEVDVKAYNNINDLLKDYSSNDLAILDLENYNYYKTSSFKDSRINYLFDSNDKYGFVINNKEENKVFEDMLNFYLSYVSINSLISSQYRYVAYENINIIYILIIIIIILLLYVVLDFSNHLKYMMKRIKKNKKVHLTKEEKIKYIDQLTSLKNRAYLNSRIESWDDSEVYPQSIIIIDLNNISYINDNYGREEGDKVITEAANILIMHQLSNSEIIRTDGNEFLIYLVGYNEKQIISYRRKLTKELKGLSHGFGAASGYSIINDAIKTVDDAVNEATLDMKNNKEDIDY